ncbi:MAG: T9SS C-terminal target domain-containing protein, partial [Bacteroidetes bacterium]
DSTELDSLQGILTYQWNFVKLLPRYNADFFRVRKASCTETAGGGGAALNEAGTLVLRYGPNPASHFVWVEVPPTYGLAKARLYTLEGRQLQETSFSGQAEIDLSRLPQGLYLLEVEAGGASVRVRLIHL